MSGGNRSDATTRPVDSLAACLWDVVVVGAGPSGAAAAIGLARAGASVLLVDRTQFPRSKVCGCCLNSRALEVIDACGVGPSIGRFHPHPFHELRLATGGAMATVPLRSGLSLSRSRLDAALAAAATSAGACFVDGRAASLVGSAPGSALLTVALRSPLDGDAIPVQSKVVVAADGLAGGFAASVLGRRAVRAGSRIGAGATLPADAAVTWRDHAINMALGREGYVGAVRLEDGRWNVAAALDAATVALNGGIATVVRSILRASGWSASAELDAATWRGTPRLTQRPAGAAGHRLFVVGDAAGYVEPFTGEGIASALVTGCAVVPLVMRAVDRWDPSLAREWTRTATRLLRPPLWRAAAAAWTSRHPALTTDIVGLLARRPGFATVALALMNQTVASPGARS